MCFRPFEIPCPLSKSTDEISESGYIVHYRRRHLYARRIEEAIKIIDANSGSTFLFAKLGCYQIKELSPSFSQEDIFSRYAEISEACKRLILEQDEDHIGPQLDQWFKMICQERYQPEDVKSFF